MSTRTNRLDAAARRLDELHPPPDKSGVTLEQWKAGAAHVRVCLFATVGHGELPTADERAAAWTAGLIAAGADPSAARAVAEATRTRRPTAVEASILEAEARRAASSNPPAPAGPTGH